MDAAIGKTYSCIVVVARDWRGEVVLAISKKTNTTIPLQAEAKALLWATQLAGDLEVEMTCFESDSKLVIEAASRTDMDFSWRL